jgi:Predicted pPIWI-associating nuclease
MRRVRSTHVSAASAIEAARGLVQKYFREARPYMVGLKVPVDRLAPLDGIMQEVLRLAAARSRKRSYLRLVNEAGQLMLGLAAESELRLGEHENPARASTTSGPLEERIIRTLSELVPSAGASYQQVIFDLNDQGRVSFRGTANELREVLREVLDRLAPDDAVASEPGFKLEDGQSRPTQKQKARYILKSRKISRTAMRAPEQSVSLIEELTASVTRAVYERGSVSAHLSAKREEVLRAKGYVDAVLAELLEIHRMR